MQSTEASPTGRNGAFRGRPPAVPAVPEKLAHTTTEAARLASCGKTTLFKALASGELKFRKLGKKTLVLDSDLRAWITSLPAGMPRKTAA